MELPTVFVLAVLVSSLSLVACQSGADDSEVSLNAFREPFRTWDYGYKCPSLYGHFPHPKSCEYFYSCVFGVATLMHCNRGYLYDIRSRRCLDSRRVKCHIKGNKDENKGKDKVTNDFVCPAIYGRYPHPKSCEYFFECKFSKPTLMHCNKGYLYDAKKEMCRESKKVKCNLVGDKEGNKDKEIIDNNRIRNFKCPYIWGTFAHPWDCAQYVVCIYSVPKWFRCNNGFLYDDKLRKCMPSNKVKCGSRWTPDELRTLRPVTVTTPMVPTVTEEITTTEDPNRFICPFPDGRFADPEDCSRYYDCDKTVPYLHECPNNTLYDERMQECLDRNLVKCDSRPGGDDGGVEKDIQDIFTCPYTWGTFTHPYDCSKYIVCIYDVPTVFSCKKHQLFDEFLRRCIPSEEVDCKDRYNPDDQFTTTTALPPTTKTTTTRISTTTTITTTPVPTTTTPVLTTTTPVPTSVDPSKKPNTPPPTDCKEDDLDCIIDVTGDVKKWFHCPQRYGHYPHGSSRQLFIHCDNWHPFIKKCSDGTVFSPTFLVCMWDNRRN